MLEPGQQPLIGLYVRLALVLGFVVVASIVGYWLGAQSAPSEEEAAAGAVSTPAQASSTAEQPAPAPPPLYFFTSVPSASARSAVAAEISMASSAGIHQYAVSVPLPWDGDMNAFLEPLNFVVGADASAQLLVHVKLDPPTSWLEAHPESSVAGPGGTTAVSLASEAWRNEAGTALGALVSAVNTSLGSERVHGFIIGCLDGGLWHRGRVADASAANQAGFRRWLKARYLDDAQLQKAWGDASVRLEDAPIPDGLIPEGPAGEGCKVFLDLPSMQRWADFLEYTSETTAGTILEFTGQIKGIAGKSARVIASYGYSFELADGGAGHFALGRLLESDLDGFASPVSYVDRGLGGAGGLMGPVDSAVLYGKQWYLIDDTRTGIARDPSTGEITRPRNVRPEDIYSVQQRNFAAALSHRIGLMWSDADGEGRLHDSEMWKRFGAMSAIYSDSAGWGKEESQAADTADAEEEGLQAGEMSELAVVVDEESRFVEGCAGELNELLLTQVRDSAARAGLPVKYYLLRDVISGKAPGADLYLFLNAFKLEAEERARLRGVLEGNRATAIWMYAPGYFGDEGASVENIAQLTGIQVKAFDGPEKTGSTFVLTGKWMEKDETFGGRMTVEPLFYIEDENADMLAKFTASGKPSVATKFFEEGWGSVLCAEPSLTPKMLREILGILEVFLCYQPGAQNFYDTFFFGESFVGIHGKDSGERTLELDRPADITDLMSPEVGWQRRRVITLPLKTGDTRLLKIRQ